MPRKLILILAICIFIPGLAAGQKESKEAPGKPNPPNIFGYTSVPFNNKPDDDIIIPIALTYYYNEKFAEEPEKFEWKVTGLPDGAVFDYNNLRIVWKGLHKPIARYSVRIEVRYEEIEDIKNISFAVTDNMQSAFLPAIGYSVYKPKQPEATGEFAGVSIQYALVSWIHRNENRGPCYGQWYISLDMLETDMDGGQSCFIYGSGLDLSFERNPSRKWLLPYFGAYFGWINHSEIGNRFLVSPEAGIWLWADRNLYINTKASYLLPTKKFESYQGLRLTLSVNFSLW